MTHPADPDAELRNVITRGGAVIVAGTGVSMAASLDASTGKSHPEASWAGLLENGLEWLKQNHLIPPEEAAAHITFLKSKRSGNHHFVSAAQDVTRLMGGVESQHFSEWLERTIGSITAHDRQGLDALDALRRHGHLLATTNYDGLLLDQAGALKPVTWKEPDAFLRAARNKETDKIIFLHGYWRQPPSVILDWDSYHQIARDDQYRQNLDAVWKMTTWLYVGCGVNGLNDPDFGLLLERYGKRARNADLWDFCLVLRSQRDEFQAHFDKQEFNICAVAFGDSLDQLPGYLRSLLPADGPAKSVMAAVVQPPVEPITEFLRVTESFFQYRAPTVAAGSVASGGRGDFRFTAEEFRSGAVHRAQVVDVALNRLSCEGCVWLEGPSAGGKTTVCLHLVAEWNHQGCEPLYLDLADEPNAEQAAREMTAHAKSGRMFILDNVHDAPKLACALLDQWKTQRRDSVMVLLGWPAAVRPGHDYLSGHRSAIITVAVQAEDWIGVYQSTYRLIRGTGQVSPVPPANVVKDWDETFAADLVTFQYALAAGLRLGHGNAFQIERAAADHYVREKYLSPCSAQERHDLFLVAWFAELGVGLGEESTPSHFTHSLGCGLIRTTLHGRFRDHVRFQPWHRSFARLLRGLASDSDRQNGLCEAAASNPYSASIVAFRLHQRGEDPLATQVLESTLNQHPSLADWFGDTLSLGPTMLPQVKNLIPARWTEAASKLAESCKDGKLQAQTFATPLQFLVTFLQFTGQSEELKPVQVSLCKALADDAKLPAGQSKLQAQAFATPFGDLVTFLRFTGLSAELKPVQVSLCKALGDDAKLPAEQSRLQAQALATPLGDLVTFLRFTGQTAELKQVHDGLVKALADDARLPAVQSKLQAQAFATPLHFLVTFLQFIGQPTNQLKQVHDALCKALGDDAKLPAVQSKLQAQAFATPLHFLVTFLQFIGQPANQLKQVHDALVKALTDDAKLPAGQSKLQAQAFATPLHFLVTFLQFIGQPANQLKQVHDALVKALADDAKLPAEQSRLQVIIFATPLHFLVTFLQFTGQSAELKPVQVALCEALGDDAKLPADQSRLMRIARDTKNNNLRGFVNGVRLIPEAASLGGIIERDTVCAKVLRIQAESRQAVPVEIKRPAQPTAIMSLLDSVSSTPLLLRNTLEERIQAGIKRVLTEAWVAVPDETAEVDRFKTARREAADIISRLSPHIKRQVGAHFQTKNWEPLKERGPKP